MAEDSGQRGGQVPCGGFQVCVAQAGCVVADKDLGGEWVTQLQLFKAEGDRSVAAGYCGGDGERHHGFAAVVAERAPTAKLCLDTVRRQVWNTARRTGMKTVAAQLKDCRYALWKKPEDLTERQQAKLSLIEATNKPLYRAYLLKEQLRKVFAPGGPERLALLDAWLAWACRSKLQPFVKLARTIRTYRTDIANALTYHLTNARVESMNTKIRLIIRRAYGFRSVEALRAMILLCLAGYTRPLPGRT